MIHPTLWEASGAIRWVPRAGLMLGNQFPMQVIMHAIK